MRHKTTDDRDPFVALLGKPSGSPEVAAFVADYGPAKRERSDTLRYYLVGKKTGVNLLIEDDRVIDVQIYVQARHGWSPFTRPLPFGLRAGMTQDQIHEQLGPPAGFDEFDSRYPLDEGRLMCCYESKDSPVLEYISIGYPPQ